MKAIRIFSGDGGVEESGKILFEGAFIISMPLRFHEIFLQFFNLLQQEFFVSISFEWMVYKKSLK